MITDSLKNAKLYAGLGQELKASFEYLQEVDFATLEDGRRDIDGDRIYVIIQSYETKAGGQWEAHKKYMDLQYVISGYERMGYANKEALKPTTAYDAEKDCLFLEGDGSFFLVPEGSFAVFAPQDAHIPGLLVGMPAPVRKAVVKIRIE